VSVSRFLPQTQQGTPRELHWIFLPICTVATAVTAMCKYCGGVFVDVIRTLVTILFLITWMILNFLICVLFLWSFSYCILWYRHWRWPYPRWQMDTYYEMCNLKQMDVEHHPNHWFLFLWIFLTLTLAQIQTRHKYFSNWTSWNILHTLNTFINHVLGNIGASVNREITVLVNEGAIL
jgi:hypothetical protein